MMPDRPSPGPWAPCLPEALKACIMERVLNLLAEAMLEVEAKMRRTVATCASGLTPGWYTIAKRVSGNISLAW